MSPAEARGDDMEDRTVRSSLLASSVFRIYLRGTEPVQSHPEMGTIQSYYQDQTVLRVPDTRGFATCTSVAERVADLRTEYS